MTIPGKSADVRPSSRTHVPCSAVEHQTENQKTVYSLERLPRPAPLNGASPSSLWMPSYPHGDTTNLEHPDVGSSLAANCLFKHDLKSFLRLNGTIAKTDTKSGGDHTKNGIEMSEEAVLHAGLTEDVAYPLEESDS